MQWSKMSLLLTVFGFAFLFTGCAAIEDIGEDKDNNNNGSFQKGGITTYVYHKEDCSYCDIVKPYVEYISSEMDNESLKFYFCDIKNPQECSQMSIDLGDKIGLKVVPTIVVVSNNTSREFVGWKEICDLGAYYQDLGIELPVITCHGKKYSVQECVNCHRDNELIPPSKFDCTCPEIN